MRWKVAEPLLLLGKQRFANVDIRVRVKGGGHVSQIYGESTERRQRVQLRKAWFHFVTICTGRLVLERAFANEFFILCCSHPPGHCQVAGRLLPEM